MLVFVGVGLGKILVIICKIVYLVKYCGIFVYCIIVMMFINKVVCEMKECVIKLLLCEEVKGFLVLIFYIFGLNMLCLELKYILLKNNFFILDVDDCKCILMDLMYCDNLFGVESKELIVKVMKMILDWKNDLILFE